MKSREIHLNAYLKGAPKTENYSVVEVDLPAPAEGQITVRNLYISVDPYMRGRMRRSRSSIPAFCRHKLSSALPA